jgi:signal transduction histidine kinase
MFQMIAHAYPTLKRILQALALSFLCLVVQHADLVVSFPFKEPVQFIETSTDQWNADLSHLTPGLYYLSLGRPRAYCDLSIDGKMVDSNRWILPDVRSKLFVGAPLLVAQDNPAKNFKIHCEREASSHFKTIGIVPVLAKYRTGVLIHELREVLDLLVGPFFTIVFVACILINLKTSRRAKLDRTVHLAFAIAAFVYSLSHTHIVRTLLPSNAAWNVHIYLKNIFTFTFALFVGTYVRRKSSIMLFIALFFSVLFAGLFYVSIVDKREFEHFYDLEFILFLIPIFVLVIELLREKNPEDYIRILQTICLCYLFLQFADYLIVLGYISVTYCTPSFIALTGSSFAYLKLRETLSAEQEKQRLQIEVESSKKLAEMASQVAHDLRSPIAVLNVLESDLSELSQDKRVLLVSVIQRVKDIASELLDRNKAKLVRVSAQSQAPQCHVSQPAGFGSTQDLSFSPTMLSAVVESIVTEKQIEYRKRSKVQVTHSQGLSDYRLFADVNEKNLSRILSNLISNSAEAISDEGVVNLCLHERGNEVWIEVRDTGEGIHSDVLPSLMRPGATFGKVDGHGLGLFHAKSVVESWKGQLEIESEVGEGTLVRIRLPLVKAHSNSALHYFS